MHHRGILAGLDHRRHAFLEVEETLRPGARVVVQVPVETFGQVHRLGGLEAERMHIGDEHQQASQLLLGRDAEFSRLLDRIDGVAAGICQADNLRA